MRLGFAPGALVLHYQGTTTGNSPDVTKNTRPSIHLVERNKLLLTRDYYPLRILIVALVAFVTLFLRYPRRGAWRQLRYALGGWLAGLRNERGPPPWMNV
jgi:GT2 family glycosyltransferase